MPENLTLVFKKATLSEKNTSEPNAKKGAKISKIVVANKRFSLIARTTYLAKY
jgi:hypothetical protein